jgi:putative RecB family exonuclease
LIVMSLPLPTSLSPSKVSSFKDCALAFRFSAIDHLPEAPSLDAVKGTLVHRALELLMWEEEPGRRTPEIAMAKLAKATEELGTDAEYAGLGLGADAEAAFVADAGALVRNYFELEDPNAVRVIGTELMLSVQIGALSLRGIIDRLEVDGNGGLVITDYKTGRAPAPAYEQSRFGGLHFYAYLCEKVVGIRPVRVQLLHLREPLAISTIPSEQSVRGLWQRASAVWEAVERACERDDFRPNPGPLCNFCAFHAYCPAWGGDPGAAVQLAATIAAGQASCSARPAGHRTPYRAGGASREAPGAGLIPIAPACH